MTTLSLTKLFKKAPSQAKSLCGGLLVFSLVFSAAIPLTLPVLAEAPPSRLSQLMLSRSMLFLPSRLVLGEENRFIFKGKAGNKVILFISPKSEGFTLPNGLALRVGADHERLEGVVNEKGVLELNMPVPDEPGWAGSALFFDAVQWSADDFSDIEQFTIVDNTGRRTSQNALVMSKRAERGGASIMPNLPGVPAQALQQLTTMSEVMSTGDERRKELLDLGDRNSDTLLDRNSLIQRPGGANPIK